MAKRSTLHRKVFRYQTIVPSELQMTKERPQNIALKHELACCLDGAAARGSPYDRDMLKQNVTSTHESTWLFSVDSSRIKINRTSCVLFSVPFGLRDAPEATRQ
uniref:Uncharacterized protein n=1 Tax=Grammatophora oceanica TaxID=210454 RepID=A0A6U5J8G8_9STRA|mmetsp:Transcript_23810/g.35222  ORF Transcript_23810/g.35222 Transcript_23810/m.35222 type:complete len:104 (+) Transcript_23810:504-815(+)